MPADSRPMHRLAELDALRGLAALAVGTYHLTYFLPSMVAGARQASVSVWWGCYGVQLFFAISGFVILGTLERICDLRRFASARARRLFPEYWLAMAITASVAALFGPERLRVDLLTWLCNLPMMQLWTGVQMVDGVYWSLTIEVGFYALMALAWRLGWTRRVETLVVAWLAAKWLLVAVAAPAWATLLLLTEHAPYFAIGLVAYRIWTGERRVRDQVPVLAAIVVTVWLLDPIHAHWLVAGMIPLFVLLAAGRIAFLAHPVLVWMGAISYPFYLLHAVIGYTIIVRLEEAGVGADAAMLAALATAGLLATAVTAVVERARRLRFARREPVLATA